MVFAITKGHGRTRCFLPIKMRKYLPKLSFVTREITSPTSSGIIILAAQIC
jgi:hypothetical protein